MSPSEPPDHPELADVGRLARRLVDRAVQTARTEDQPLRRLLLEHLGPDAAILPTVSATWPSYEHVNVQVGLEAWLGQGDDRSHEVFGITGIGFMRHMEIVGIGDFLQPRNNGPFGSASFGGVMTVAVPSGPGEQTYPCVSHGIYLVDDAGARLAVILQPVDRGPHPEVVLQITGTDQDRIDAVLDEIRTLASERSVFRGQVISFGPEVFGMGRQVPMNFLERPSVGRDQIVLPAEVLDNIERQVLGVGRHSGRLLASGQHLKRGVLLHGAPGTGKTHTVGYLLGQLPQATVIVISGRALGRIREACSVARSLQPAIVVVEDVDLIAEQREARPGEHPLLFQLLNEMDGLNSGADVTFLLTTNRADLLEPALAARPGRVDLAAELPLPDADARRQLIRLYQGSLVLDLTHPETIIERTDGVTAAFLKELLRRAALLSCEADPADAPDDPIRVTDTHLTAALDQLLDSRNQLTRILLGGESPRPKPDHPHPKPDHPRPKKPTKKPAPKAVP
ncbi:MAG TPA: ATP-binding protein [Streptosporangiaceae bacterium]|nr:ATP-binding protein [Streptosporangiaceae bacterium]